MRIVIVSHEPFYPPSGGGSSEALYIAQALVARGHEVVAITPRCRATPPVWPPGLSVREYVLLDIHRHTRFRLPKYVGYGLTVGRLLQAAHREQPFDLILVQHIISAPAAEKWARQTGTPLVLNYLDCLTGYFDAWPAWTGARLWAQPLTNWELTAPQRWQAAGVLTISDTLKDEFVRRGYPAEKIVSIYYGFDETVFFPAAEAASPPASAPVVAMHGSFDYHHLGAIARDAMLTVLAALPQTQFRFIGPETTALRSLLAEVRRVQPDARLECTGFVPYRDVGAQLRSATVGMIPYAASGGSRFTVAAKAIEFAACGLPFAATGMEGTQRFFKDIPCARFCGFDGAELGHQLLRLIQLPAAEHYAAGLQASRMVRTVASWPVLTGKVADFMQRLVPEQRRG